jgi:ankyrin repeat protein
VALCLLRQGADPNLFSEFDLMTPLQAARRQGDAEMAALLRKLGAIESRPSLLRRWWRLACAS